MDDLLQRLRDAAQSEEMFGFDGMRDDPDPLLTEAADEIERLRADADRYRWLCDKLGQTQLPTLIERITSGYVADYKPSIDAAIDAAMKSK